MTPEASVIGALMAAIGVLASVIAVLWKRGGASDDALVMQLRAELADSKRREAEWRELALHGGDVLERNIVSVETAVAAARRTQE